MKRQKLRRMARAVVIYKNRILLLKRNKFGYKFYTLPGGEIDDGELPEDAARREVFEECSIKVEVKKPLYTNNSEGFGFTTYFLCKYKAGEPTLQPDSIEARRSAVGSNIYEPMWSPLSTLLSEHTLPREVALQIAKDYKTGFTGNVKTLGA